MPDRCKHDIPLSRECVRCQNVLRKSQGLDPLPVPTPTPPGETPHSDFLQTSAEANACFTVTSRATLADKDVEMAMVRYGQECVNVSAAETMHSPFLAEFEERRLSAAHSLVGAIFRYQRLHPPAPVSPRPEGLDFGKAQKALQDAGVPFPDFIIPQPARDTLDAQHRAALEGVRKEKRQAYEDGVEFGTRTTREEHEALRALVVEWQEARKGEGVKDMAETLRFAGACQALAAWEDK